MARLGAHPRLAAMLLAARTPEEQALAADIAALLEERDPLRAPDAPADISLRLDAIAPATRRPIAARCPVSATPPANIVAGCGCAPTTARRATQPRCLPRRSRIVWRSAAASQDHFRLSGGGGARLA